MNKLYNIILLAATGTILLIASFLIGITMGSRLLPKISGAYEIGFQAGWEKANETLKQSKILPPEPEEIKFVSGIVNQVKDNEIVIDAYGVTLNPLELNVPKVRKILITSETKFFKQTLKPSSEFQKEIQAYNEQLIRLKGKEVLPSPSPTKEEEGELSGIKSGMRILVYSDDNIKFKESIIATSITYFAE